VVKCLCQLINGIGLVNYVQEVKMEKHLITFGIVFFLLITFFSGCNELNNKNENQVDIIGKIEDKNLILENQEWKGIEYDDLGISLSINQTDFFYTSSYFVKILNDGTNDTDGYFGVGDRIIINNENINMEIGFDLFLIDLKTDSVIMEIRN
jgi:hypothetical protein